MNNCFVHLADARVAQPLPHPPTYTPAALGRWDPDLMNQDEFGESFRATIEYDSEGVPHVVALDIDDSSGGEDETSEGDDSCSCTPALSSSTSSAEHKGQPDTPEKSEGHGGSARPPAGASPGSGKALPPSDGPVGGSV